MDDLATFERAVNGAIDRAKHKLPLRRSAQPVYWSHLRVINVEIETSTNVNDEEKIRYGVTIDGAKPGSCPLLEKSIRTDLILQGYPADVTITFQW